RWKVSCRGPPRDIRPTFSIHGDRRAHVVTTTPEVRRIDQGGAYRIHLRDKNIIPAGRRAGENRGWPGRIDGERHYSGRTQARASDSPTRAAISALEHQIACGSVQRGRRQRVDG